MPSPIGHSLCGLGVGLVYILPHGVSWNQLWESTLRHWRILFCGIIFANLPDLDFIPGMLTGEFNAYHHWFTHTLGWVLLMALGVWLLWRAAWPEASWREFFFLVALGVSHLLADWFTADSRPPLGIMAFWPISDQFFIAPTTVFLSLRKRTLLDALQPYNFEVMLHEICVILPLILAVVLYKRYTPRREPSL